jgi:hypothetical protein
LLNKEQFVNYILIGDSAILLFFEVRKIFCLLAFPEDDEETGSKEKNREVFVIIYHRSCIKASARTLRPKTPLGSVSKYSTRDIRGASLDFADCANSFRAAS